MASSDTRFFFALFFQILILIMLGMILFRIAYQWLVALGYQKAQIRHIFLFLLAIYLLSALFCFVFFRAERDIKVYDSSVYWIKVLEDRVIIAKSIPEYFVKLGTSFGHEYNNLAAFPLIPFSYLFGTSFGAYCLSIFYVYYLPACFFLVIFALRLAKLAFNNTSKLFTFFLCFSLCVLNVGMLWPVMNGYMDVAGVLVIALMLNSTLSWGGVSFDWKRNLTLSLLSLALLLLRRWYAYYIVGFYFALFVNLVIVMLQTRKFSLRAVGRFAGNMLMIAVTSAAVMFLINRNLFSLFFRDYRNIYSAYNTMSLWQNIWNMSRNMGLFYFAICCTGAFLMLRAPKSRMVAIRLLTALFTAFFLFSFVQDLNFHHHYLLIPTFLIFLCGLTVLANEYLFQRKKAALTAVVMSLCVLNFSYGYIPALQTISLMTEPFTSVLHNYPKQNVQYDAILDMVSDLDKKLANSSDHIYVVGDGNVLSTELLEHAYLPDTINATPFVYENCIVDQRDGFPSHLFFAEYVLISNPFQTDFQDVQQVSYQVYDMFINDPVIARYYQLDTSYEGAEYNYLLFRKTAQLDAKCVDVLKERLYASYPDTPFVYEPNYFIALCQVEDDGEHRFDYYWNKSIILKKQAAKQMRLKWNIPTDAKQLSFRLSNWAEGLEMVLHNENGVLYSSPIEIAEDREYIIDIEGSQKLTLSFVEQEQHNPVSAELILNGAAIRN